MTITSESSPVATVVDDDTKSRTEDKAEDSRARSPVPPQGQGSADKKGTPSINSQPLATQIPQAKKWGLLGVFSLAFFVDIWSYSAFFLFTDPISIDLDVEFAQQSWIIVSNPTPLSQQELFIDYSQTSYAVTFAAFLLFWGRVSDLYSAKPVFAYGFLALGVLNTIISFLPDKYSFFILRAVSGIAGATLIPAAFRLIVAIFEPHELSRAFTIYGMSGALANVTGTIIAGLLEYIPTGGQGAPWRWFFRILGVIIIPISVMSLVWIPKPRGEQNEVEDKWKRLDLVGAFLMLSSIVLLILGLTLGASYGFKTAGFLAPFLLSWPLCIGFFFWEARIPDEYALLPAKTWRIPNFTILIVFALYIYAWFSLNYLPLVEISTKVYGEKSIIAALRILPQGVVSGIVSLVLSIYPFFTSRLRWLIPIAFCFGLVGYALFVTWTGDQMGTNFWTHVFLGGVLGGGGMNAVFAGTNVAVMTSVPPEMAGVAGAVLQVALQVGSSVALSIQAGLWTIKPGGIYNFTNVQISWYFAIGWGVVWLVAFLVFYRPVKKTNDDKEGGEQQVAGPTH